MKINMRRVNKKKKKKKMEKNWVGCLPITPSLTSAAKQARSIKKSKTI